MAGPHYHGWLPFIVALSLATLALLAGGVAARRFNCPSPPPPSLIEEVPGMRIIAIGDIHGDLKRLKQILRVAGVLAVPQDDDQSDSPVWIADSTTYVVQTGDLIDGGGRGGMQSENTMAEMDAFVAAVKKSAVEVVKGERFFTLFGNHEMMNLQGNFRYLSNAEKQEYGIPLESEQELELDTEKKQLFLSSWSKRWEAFKPGSVRARHWACTRNVVMKIGPAVFAHGGIAAFQWGLFPPNSAVTLADTPFAQLSPHAVVNSAGAVFNQNSLVEWNHVFRSFMIKPVFDRTARQKIYDNSHQNLPMIYPPEAIFSTLGPLWWRGYGKETDLKWLPDLGFISKTTGMRKPNQYKQVAVLPEFVSQFVQNLALRGMENLVCSLAKDTLQKLGAEVMVVGHSIQVDGINGICENKVWRIDVMMSDAFRQAPFERASLPPYLQALQITRSSESNELVFTVLDANLDPGKKPSALDLATLREMSHAMDDDDDDDDDDDVGSFYPPLSAKQQQLLSKDESGATPLPFMNQQEFEEWFNDGKDGDV